MQVAAFKDLLNASCGVQGFIECKLWRSRIYCMHVVVVKPTDKKYFLFLDLDETLIHSFTVPRTEFASERERKEYYDEISRLLTIENGIAPTQEELECYPSEMVFNIRPGTEEFLAQLSKYYELSIFTAGE